MATTDVAWLQDRITATQTAITQIEAAIPLIAAGAQTYQLDTMQTRVLVTKSTLRDLTKALDILENRLAVLKQRLYGDGNSIGRPAF